MFPTKRAPEPKWNLKVPIGVFEERISVALTVVGASIQLTRTKHWKMKQPSDWQIWRSWSPAFVRTLAQDICVYCLVNISPIARGGHVLKSHLHQLHSILGILGFCTIFCAYEESRDKWCSSNWAWPAVRLMFSLGSDQQKETVKTLTLEAWKNNIRNILDI